MATRLGHSCLHTIIHCRHNVLKTLAIICVFMTINLLLLIYLLTCLLSCLLTYLLVVYFLGHSVDQYRPTVCREWQFTVPRNRASLCSLFSRLILPKYHAWLSIELDTGSCWITHTILSHQKFKKLIKLHILRRSTVFNKQWILFWLLSFEVVLFYYLNESKFCISCDSFY